MNDVPPKTPSPSGERYQRERHFARRTALQFLYQADLQEDWGNLARNLSMLKQQIRDLEDLPEDGIVARSWPFTERLIRGVVQNRAQLDEQIGACATNWTVARMSAIDRNILRLAAFQLCFCDDVPPLTAVDEGVELAKEFGHVDSSRFVNGVLDRLLKECGESGETEESRQPD